MWQEGWREAAGGGRGARGHGGQRGVSQSPTPAGWSVGGSDWWGCAGQVVFFFFLFLNDEPEVAAVCIYPAGRGFSSREAAAGRGRLCCREGDREGGREDE